jgi:hypothetical protein
MFQALKLFPGRVLFMEGEVLALGLFGLIGLLILLVPFLDVGASREKRSFWVSLAGLLLLAAIVSLTIWGLLASGGST